MSCYRLLRAGVISCVVLSFLAGCSSKSTVQTPQKKAEVKPQTNAGRYSMQNDKAPIDPPDVSKVPNAVPRHEPLSRGGNRSPYEVFGQTYHILPSAKGYKEKGGASWYGLKFHGHLTSNGEVYDMYEMTAAHKSLPLPTYARVTNLDNGRSVIVRINDRGPFHEGRIIDLSYAAAYQLDILRNGTGRVEVEAIVVEPPWSENIAASKPSPSQTQEIRSQVRGASPVVSLDRRYLQIGAFSTEVAAKRVQAQVSNLSAGVPVGIYPAQTANGSVYRVKIGPFNIGDSLDSLMARLQSAGYPSAHLVDRP